MADSAGRQNDPSEAPTAGGPGPHSAPTVDQPAPASATPARIGRYHVRRLIGVGGMGSVYEAVQENPRRIVAVKILNPGVASPRAMRRFEYEAQLLARLHHPGIAQIYEAGTYPGPGGESVPFFAMEYIPQAMPITEYARTRGLDLRERLDLFLQICSAVAHGHAKGIIHRDLKPSNILVDADGHPRIIDFGVARGTDSDLALTTLQTGLGQIVGTLQYMSPEQCAGDPRALDHRTDIYALGVVLYELLCDRVPYDLSTVPAHDAPRALRESYPNRPSTINRTVSGDLETIILRALHKDRERRYQSVQDLEADLRRYLDGRPIAARRDSIPYAASLRLRALASRQRAAAVAATVLVAALIGAFLGPPLLRMTDLDRRHQVACAAFAEPLQPPTIDHVRVIAMTGDLAEIARAAGVEFDPGVAVSFRAVHGKLLERLAAAMPRVVAFDLTFRHPAAPRTDPSANEHADPTPYDEALLAGVRALRNRGIPTVVAYRSYNFTRSGEPPISRVIAAETCRGSTAFSGGPELMWVVPAVRDHPGDGDPRSALALAVLAAWREPEALRFTPHLDPASPFVRLDFWNPAGAERRPVGRPATIRLNVGPWNPPEKYVESSIRGGVFPGDTVAYFPLDPPSDQACAATTLDYLSIFTMSDAELQEALGGKVALIADLRNESDRFSHPTGRSVRGPYIQAAAMEALLSGRIVQTLSAPMSFGIATAAAALGAWIAVRLRMIPRLWALVGVIALAAAAGPVLYVGARLYVNPGPALIALILALVITGVLLSPARRPSTIIP